MRRLAASVLSQQRRFLASGARVSHGFILFKHIFFATEGYGSMYMSSAGAQPAPRQPLLAACVIERIPSVLPQPEDWELSYWVRSASMHPYGMQA